MVALKSRMRFATQSRNAIGVTNIYDPRHASDPRDADETARYVREVTEILVPPALRSHLVLLQIHESGTEPADLDPLELVRRLKVGSPFWGILYIGRGGIYGADDEAELYFFRLPQREYGVEDWTMFCVEVAELYSQSFSLSEAVSRSLERLG